MPLSPRRPALDLPQDGGEEAGGGGGAASAVGGRVDGRACGPLSGALANAVPWSLALAVALVDGFLASGWVGCSLLLRAELDARDALLSLLPLVDVLFRVTWGGGGSRSKPEKV